MTTIRLPECKCPMCGYLLDALSGMREGRDIDPEPAEHTATICISCASILFLNKDMTLREPTREDLKRFREEDPETYEFLLYAQKKCREMDRTRINNDRG